MPYVLEDTRQQVLSQLTGTPHDRRVSCERRSPSLGSFVRGSVRPRRRAVRRESEADTGFLDWHESRLLYLAITIVLLSCIDALFTLNLLTVGAHEANLFMDKLLGSGVPNFLAVKISLTCVGVVLLVIAAHRSFLGWFRVVRLLQLACLGYGALIAYELYLIDSILGLSGPNALGWRAIFG